MYRYLPVRETLVSEEVGTYVAYGICVFQEENEINKVVKYISDVFSDHDTAMRFSALCTSEQLDPIHLLDVIDDNL